MAEADLLPPSPGLRVLVTTSTFPVSADRPTVRFVMDLAAGLSASCDVTVLAPDAPDAKLSERIGDLDVRRFTYFRPRRLQRLAYGSGMRDNLRSSLLAKAQVPFFFLSQVLALRRVIKEKQPHVVNSHWMIPQGLSAAFLRRRKGSFRHVLHVHAAGIYLLRRLPLGRLIARYVVRGTDFIFADGSHVRDTLDELLGYPSGAVLRPMGVNSALFGGGEGGRPVSVPFEDGYVLFFGRFSEKKGVEYLLEAMPKVLVERPRVGLVLIGYGNREEALRRLVAELGIGESVSFAGRQPHQEIVRYLHGCRAAVVPSIVDSKGETEGMPTVVVEALAAGARVVASAVDGIPDVVEHGVNGWLCREKDPEDLAAKILLALADPDPSEMRQAALATGRRFDWQEVANEYLEIFRRLVPEPGA